MAKELNFLCFSHGLMPFDDDARVWLSARKRGELATINPTVKRNGKFFSKWWALIQVAFDWWQPEPERNMVAGKKVEKNLERFRKDIIIQTGRYDALVNTKNEVKAEAHSISWAKMDEVEFTKLYNDTITVLLKILPDHIREEDLRNVEASIMEFD